jgi:ABC-type methionine transport system ATPase subunit
MLSPGEMVLNKRQQGNLFSLANSGGGGDSALLRELIDLLSQPQTTSVTAEVNGRAIADIVLQQSRQRARLSA